MKVSKLAKSVVPIAAGLALSVVSPSPARALSSTGYAIGGKSLTTNIIRSGATGTTLNSTSDSVVIHAPSMASSEGCPDPDDLEDGTLTVTMIHSDGTEYNCNTGDYTIK